MRAGKPGGEPLVESWASLMVRLSLSPTIESALLTGDLGRSNNKIKGTWMQVSMQWTNDEPKEQDKRFCLGTEGGGSKFAIFHFVDGEYFHVATLEDCTLAMGQWIVESMNELRRSEQRFLVRHAISTALDKCDDQLRIRRTQNQVHLADRILRHLYQFFGQTEITSEPRWQQVLTILRAYFEKYPRT